MSRRQWVAPEYNFLRPGYWFGQVDSRPLSLFRIVFALILLKDAIYDLHLIRFFYTDKGLLPREVVWRTARATRFSLLDALPAGWMVTLFFVAWIMVLMGLLVGYRTRLMTVLNFVIVVSVHERNLLVLNGADTVFRVLSFWMMFLPLGDYYAVDAVLRRWKRYTITRNLNDLRVEVQPKTVFALFLRLTQLQFGLIYLFAFIMKLPGTVWENGLALHYALQLQSIVLPTGDWVLQHAPAELLKAMSLLAFAAEGGFFLLVFAPVGQPYLRVTGMLAGVALHGGIALLMAISNFSNVMLTGYLLFWESRWVVWLDNQLRLPRQSVRIALPPPGSPLWLLLSLTRADEIEVVQRRQDLGTTPPAWDAENERRLWAHLPLSRIWARFGLVRRMAKTGASLWAGMALRVMPEDNPVILPPRGPGQWQWVGRLVASSVLLPLMVTIWWWNLHLVKVEPGRPLVGPPNATLYGAMETLGLWQSWDMFAPRPIIVDGWFLVPGVFEDGTTVDLRTERPLEPELPRIFYGMDGRWKEYQAHVWLMGNTDVLGAWGSYYCRLYNVYQARPRGERLATLQIRWRYRISADPGQPVQDWQETTLWSHWCFEEYRYGIEADLQQLCAPFCPGAEVETKEVAMPKTK